MKWEVAWKLLVLVPSVSVGLVPRVSDSLMMRPRCRVLTFVLGLRLEMLATARVTRLLSSIRVSY